MWSSSSAGARASASDDSLYAVAYRILRDTGLAEDALQNALVLAWRQLPRLREPDRFEAWIQRVLIHACYDESRRAKAWRSTVRALPIDRADASNDVDGVVDRDELERAFIRLPLEQRAVLRCGPAQPADGERIAVGRLHTR